MRYLYLDESTFGPTKKYVGYGALITDEPVPSTIIQNALAKLKADPDINDPKTQKWDQGTLARGYFHAIQDSKNGHSHLCKQISDDLNGVFTAHYFDPTHPNTHYNSNEKAYYLLSQLSSIEAFGTDQNVEFNFERRQGLSIPGLQKWHKEFEENIIASVSDNSFAPTYFPKVTFQIKDKHNPGIQCTDFILWTVNRHINGDDVWYNRLKTNFRMESRPLSDNSGGTDLKFKNEVSDPKANYTITTLPNSAIESVPGEDLIKFYFEAEKTINHYANNALPNTIEYLRPELIRVTGNRNNINSNHQVTDVARCYIKLFDMIPLISCCTFPSKKRKLLLTRYFLALTFRNDILNGVRIHDFLTKARRLNLGTNPQLLDF